MHNVHALLVNIQLDFFTQVISLIKIFYAFDKRVIDFRYRPLASEIIKFPGLKSLSTSIISINVYVMYTCVTCSSCPSRLTLKTGSILYTTCVGFTVARTWFIAGISKHTVFITTCIRYGLNYVLYTVSYSDIAEVHL